MLILPGGGRRHKSLHAYSPKDGEPPQRSFRTTSPTLQRRPPPTRYNSPLSLSKLPRHGQKVGWRDRPHAPAIGWLHVCGPVSQAVDFVCRSKCWSVFLSRCCLFPGLEHKSDLLWTAEATLAVPSDLACATWRGCRAELFFCGGQRAPPRARKVAPTSGDRSPLDRRRAIALVARTGEACLATLPCGPAGRLAAPDRERTRAWHRPAP
jgi:hypothetical protein